MKRVSPISIHRQVGYFLKKCRPTEPLFVIFVLFKLNFTEKTVGFSGFQTQIVGIEGKHADHLTTTTAPRQAIIVSLMLLLEPSRSLPKATELFSLKQIWARYLEGDNISTKIGSRSRSGWPSRLIPTLQEKPRWPSQLIPKCRDMSGCPIPSFP